MKQRSIVTAIIFSIITCGIYFLYWFWVTLSPLEQEGKRSIVPTFVSFILLLFVSPVGGALGGYDADNNLSAIYAARGIPRNSNQIVYIIVGILLPIVMIALVQNEINGLLRNSASSANQNNTAL